jgi:predicted Zn-dependent protease
MKRLLLTAALASAAAVGPAGCGTVPATGQRAFMLMSWDDERNIGAQAAPEFTEQFGGKVQDTALQEYLEGVGMPMTMVVEPGVPSLDWEFTLLDSEVVNAFALPGGKIFMTRGLAERLENEAQMAGVLGHEIGHVTARHGNQRMSKHLGFNLALAVGTVAWGVADEESFQRYGQIGVPAVMVGGNLVLLKYGREEEIEADMLGMRYMSRVGYDPAAQADVMRILGGESAGGRPPEWLSTHPYPETRIDRIGQLLRSEYAHTQGNPDYQTYERRYRDRFLTPLADYVRRQAGAGPQRSPVAQAAFSLDNPATWCGHCAAEAHAAD